MTHKVGPKGQVVIPKELRDRLGIHPGGEVVFVEDGDGVRVELLGDIRKLGGSLADSSIDLTKELERDRREAREKEERELREWADRRRDG